MQTASPLINISIILVDTKTPANIGAAARCMMNAGLSRLILVNPPRDRNNDAVKLAAGADAVLDNAETFFSLREAVHGHGLVVGTSRHSGRLRKNVRTPREMAAAIGPLLANNRVAVVFGNEINGLDNDDLALCQDIVTIPSSDAFPSLNLSHAVMIVAYELFIATCELSQSSTPELALAEDRENFYLHLQKTLQNIGFLERDHPGRMMSSLRNIFGRSRLDSREVKILRGILAEIDRSTGCKNPPINND